MTKLEFAIKVVLYLAIGILLVRIIGAVVDAEPTFKPITAPVTSKPVAKPAPVKSVPTTAPTPTPVSTPKPVPVTSVKQLSTTAVKPAVPKSVPVPAQKPVALTVGDATLNLINQTRFNLGLTQLRVANDLMASASGKCQHMSVNDYWAHNGAGRTSGSWNPRYYQFGEILARDYAGNTLLIHEAWLSSPTHYRVMTLPNVQYFGVARCTTLSGLPLTVVHFGGAINEAFNFNSRIYLRDMFRLFRNR